MGVYKRPTNAKKTRFTWGFIVNVPTNEYQSNGKIKYRQKCKWGFRTKHDALIAEKEFIKQLNTNKIETNNEATFDSIISFFLDKCRFYKYSKGTINNYIGLYNNHLNAFKGMKIKDINKRYIRHWLYSKMNNNTSCYIINNCIKLLKASFNYALQEEEITINPFLSLKHIQEPVVLRRRFNSKQLAHLIHMCKNKIPKFYCIFMLATFTGMRLGEYSALETNDIDYDNNIIVVNKQYTRRELKNKTKTINSTRIIYVPDALLEIIKWHLSTNNIKQGLLFKGKYNKPISPNWISKQFKYLLTICNFDSNYCRVHDLRGEYVDIMKTIKIPVSYISKQLGHKRTSTTDNIYTQILDDVPIEVIKATNNFINYLSFEDN